MAFYYEIFKPIHTLSASTVTLQIQSNIQFLKYNLSKCVYFFSFGKLNLCLPLRGRHCYTSFPEINALKKHPPQKPSSDSNKLIHFTMFIKCLLCDRHVYTRNLDLKTKKPQSTLKELKVQREKQIPTKSTEDKGKPAAFSGLQGLRLDVINLHGALEHQQE